LIRPAFPAVTQKTAANLAVQICLSGLDTEYAAIRQLFLTFLRSQLVVLIHRRSSFWTRALAEALKLKALSAMMCR
jgi:hypothetical protein